MRAVIIAIIIIFAAASAPLAQHRVAANTTLVKNFELSVYEEGRNPLPWMSFRRWKEEVRAVVIGKSSRTYIRNVREILHDFETLTGLSFSLSESDSAASLQIVFVPRNWYRNAVENTFETPEQVQCFATTTANGLGWIETAVVIIPDDLSRSNIEICLAHELMHALGFMGHPDPRFHSALRNGNAPQNITLNDRIMIRTYYDPSITAGMMRDEVVNTARRIINKLRNDAAIAEDPMEVLSQKRPIQMWGTEPGPV